MFSESGSLLLDSQASIPYSYMISDAVPQCAYSWRRFKGKQVPTIHRKTRKCDKSSGAHAESLFELKIDGKRIRCAMIICSNELKPINGCLLEWLHIS